MKSNQISKWAYETEYPNNLTDLYRIVLSQNKLNRLPSLLYATPNLRELYLAYNLFKQLPDLLSLYPQIQYDELRLYGNKLDCKVTNCWIQKGLRSKRIDSKRANFHCKRCEKKAEKVKLDLFDSFAI